MIIFKGVRLADGLGKNAPSGSIIRESKNGWINSELLLEWLHHFVKCIPAARPVLLIMDSHASHVGTEVIYFAYENDVHLMTFPSHCSNILQPLDLSVYKSLKNVWDKELDRFSRANPVGSPTRMDFCGLFAPAYHTAFNPVNIRNGFCKAGIYPMSRTAVNQEAVVPSRVHAETIDCLSPKGLLKPSSSMIMENIDSILSLPK
jgi:hypothetical protein